jgi:hypothetical protein
VNELFARADPDPAPTAATATLTAGAGKAADLRGYAPEGAPKRAYGYPRGAATNRLQEVPRRPREKDTGASTGAGAVSCQAERHCNFSVDGVTDARKISSIAILARVESNSFCCSLLVCLASTA